MKVASLDPLRLRARDVSYFELAIGFKLIAGAGKSTALKNSVGAAGRDND